jgi:large subunit ribosomal protein L32
LAFSAWRFDAFRTGSAPETYCVPAATKEARARPMRPVLSPAGTDQEFFMAVQQNKKSPSKRGMHRSHNALVTPGTAIEPTTGEVHLRHHISPTGFYRGRKVLKSKQDA